MSIFNDTRLRHHCEVANELRDSGFSREANERVKWLDSVVAKSSKPVEYNELMFSLVRWAFKD